MNGCPLGALITHRGIFETARASADIFARRDDVFITVCRSFTPSVSAHRSSSRCSTWPASSARPLSPKAVMAALNAGATVLAGVPPCTTYWPPRSRRAPAFRNADMDFRRGGHIDADTRHDDGAFRYRHSTGLRAHRSLSDCTWNMPGRPNRYGPSGPDANNQVRIVHDNRDCPRARRARYW